MDNIITIDLFNKLTGKETLHPLVTVADLSGDRLPEDLQMTCNFYALIYRQETEEKQRPALSILRLVNPGEIFEIPSARHIPKRNYSGVLFHPDLLCDTPLEHSIGTYPTRCRCRGALLDRERQTIARCLYEIDKELNHAIDCHSSNIIVSHIELLLNYCTRFADIKTNSYNHCQETEP